MADVVEEVEEVKEAVSEEGIQTVNDDIDKTPVAPAAEESGSVIAALNAEISRLKNVIADMFMGAASDAPDEVTGEPTGSAEEADDNAGIDSLFGKSDD